MEPKWKQHPVVDVAGDGSKIRCCKEQYCIGTWYVKSMNQGKLEVVKQEMARVNIDILGISELNGLQWANLICQQVWKTQQWPQDWKRSVFIPIPKKGNVIECSNYCTIALISHTSNVILKLLHVRLQQWTVELQMFKLDLGKAEEPEIKLPTSIRS